MRLCLGAIPALLLAAAAATAAEEVPFHASVDTFRDAAACGARLKQMTGEARLGQHSAVEGPYAVAPGDLRTHWIDVAGSGHRITEHRCLAEKLSSRSWRHSVVGDDGEEAETIEQMAAQAEWLKKGSTQQK